MRYNEFFNGFLLTCVPYKKIDKKGIIKIGDTVFTRIHGIKSQMFYKGYDITEDNMPENIQRELFDKLPDIVKQFYEQLPYDNFDKFMDGYNYFKETGRTTWL